MNEDIKALGKFLAKKIEDTAEELKDFIDDSLSQETEDIDEGSEEKSPFEEEDDTPEDFFDVEPEYEGARKVKNEPEEQKKTKKKGFFRSKKKETKEEEKKEEV